MKGDSRSGKAFCDTGVEKDCVKEVLGVGENNKSNGCNYSGNARFLWGRYATND